MELFVRLDLLSPAAFFTADKIVDGLVAVHADRNDKFLRTEGEDLFDSGNDPIRKVTVRGKVDHNQVFALAKRGPDDVCKIFSKPDLSAREVDPVESIRLPEELLDLIRRQLILGFPLPDIARLAFVVAPIGDTERELVGEVESLEIRRQDISCKA